MRFTQTDDLLAVDVSEDAPRISVALLVGLGCRTCGHVDNYQVRYPTDMWLWGLSGALESNPRQSSVLIPGALQKFVGDIMCNDCCTTSKLEIPSTKQLGEYLDASLRNMPFHGADWAMQCLANFMRLHLKGDRNSRYRTIEPDGHAPGYVYHLWLLDYCPCERCTEARHGQPPRKQVLDLTPYLVST